MDIIFNKAKNLDWLSEFYYSRNYQDVIFENDDVFYIMNDNQTAPVAVVCISYAETFPTLHGMEVTSEHQGKGLGTKLLLKIVEFMEDERVFCIPYNHLEDFYGQGGFVKIPINEAPSVYQDHIKNYTTKGMDVILMVKN